MTTTFTWTVNQMDCYPEVGGETDVVFTINWTLYGNEDVFNSNYPCATSVPYTAGQPFIPYADLTEAQVLQWIDEYTDPDMMASYYKIIADNIEQQKVVVTPPLPWLPTLP